MRRRTKAREVALQFLYQLDLRGDEVANNVDEFLASSSNDREVLDFALRLIAGTRKLQPTIDVTLAKVARNWDLRRMATIDRNALRMAIFELLHCDDIPPKVSINEAIDLGKKFSTANSGAFINGILDRVKNEFVKPEKLKRSFETDRARPPRTSEAASG
ncbi:MAG: transcription antitermination factor NusB [Planctomycetes bacterium]|jgi:transcription antitermination factor NusB|nr:transcription antitermination factor NusB [Planctomycetota bacterium]MDP6424757.1 transcription antitermination factor NusB [Planctomycetota bacterium]